MSLRPCLAAAARTCAWVGASAIALAGSPAQGSPPAAARAPGPSAAPRGLALTLESALDAARGSPAHRAAAARRRAAEAGVEAAGAWPATSIGVSTTHRAERAAPVASLPLPIFGTLAASRGVARAEAEVARIEASAVDLALRRDVKRAWLELVRAEARADLSAAAIRREAELATITRARFDAGDASHAEVVAADAVARRARAQSAADRAAISAAAADLAALLGIDPTGPLSAVGGFPAAAPVPPLDRLRARRAGHPDARAAAARIGVERAREGEARAARWPELSVDLEAMIDDPTLPGSDYRVGLTLAVPLLGKRGAAEAAAAATGRAARIERERTLATVDAELVAAYRRYQSARELARALEQDVLPSQREAAELARSAYREGQGGLVAVLDADRTLADAEADWIQARADAAVSRADLEWAVGGEL
ncbi:MAG TPA: TolC family protein [Kofleriaceae bacterium]|nr:TolC family protein [Kofleriaceae bacterium]